MSLSILHAGTLSSVAGATTQQAQCEALIAAWSGGNVNAWVYSSGNVLLQRRVQGPWAINSSTPRGVEPGAFISFEHVATGTPAYVVYRTADAAIFSTDGITFAGDIKALCGTRDRTVVFLGNSGLPVT